jgi:myo-inositol-1(or 4)-monophosphatase
VLIDNVLEHSVVFDPAKDELFSASRGRGAFLNNKPIKTSGLVSIRGGLYATGVPFSGDNFAKIECFSNAMIGVLNADTSGIRRLGSAALDLAYVAAGRYDGYWEANLQVWDIAGGVLLVTEAGGKVSGLQGDDNYLNSGHIVAATSGVHQELIEITAENYPF